MSPTTIQRLPIVALGRPNSSWLETRKRLVAVKATGIFWPIVQFLDFLLSGLLGVNGLASVLINVQNDPLTGNPEPPDWAGIDPGQYDVAAIRLGVLGLLGGGNDLDVVLAKGSVGPNVFQP